MQRVIVIGGGASGLVAAIMAARNGAAVTILERMQRVGKKLLATGNGRCNLANRYLNIARYHGEFSEFALPVFAQFGLDQTLTFFEELGLDVCEEENGELFPVCQQASSVLDVLRYEAARLGVVEVCDSIVQVVQMNQPAFRCICGDDKRFDADRVVICAGGKSSPNLGSNGGGFKLAQALGHHIVEPFPALVQLQLDAPYLNHLAGLPLRGRLQVWVDGVAAHAETGELLFAKYGLSGTAVLQASRTASKALLHHRQTLIALDLFPECSREDLIAAIHRRVAKNPHKTIDFCFVGFIHKRLIPVLLKNAGILNAQRPCAEFHKTEIDRLAALMKHWTIPCIGTQSWMFSQVTAGGVDVREVDPATLESKCAPGVFFAGEMLDIDGDSGGYNLQWAWSSGAVAGTHAARD